MGHFCSQSIVLYSKLSGGLIRQPSSLSFGEHKGDFYEAASLDHSRVCGSFHMQYSVRHMSGDNKGTAGECCASLLNLKQNQLSQQIRVFLSFTFTSRFRFILFIQEENNGSLLAQTFIGRRDIKPVFHRCPSSAVQGNFSACVSIHS